MTKEAEKLKESILYGMKLSAEKLISNKKQHGRSIFVSENGKVKEIASTDIQME